MKKTDISGLSVAQLQENLTTEKASIRNLRFAHAISPIENPMRIRASRKMIARLQTELHKRENAQQAK
jgi:large subunit ribosomal protein L29